MTKKILFIEDDKDQLDIYKTKFKLEGFCFLSACNGLDGLQIAIKENPDLIFLDIILPGKMNGIEILKQLKREKNTEQIPIIMLTNLSKLNLEDEARKNGAIEYIIKTSINLKEIISITKKILK